MLHCSVQMCRHHYSDKHTADKQSAVISAREGLREKGKYSLQCQPRNPQPLPLGFHGRAALVHSIVYMIYSRRSSARNPHALTKSQSQALVWRKRLRAAHRGGVDTRDPVLWAVQLPPWVVRCDNQLPVEGREAGRQCFSPPLLLTHQP